MRFRRVAHGSKCCMTNIDIDCRRCKAVALEAGQRLLDACIAMYDTDRQRNHDSPVSQNCRRLSSLQLLCLQPPIDSMTSMVEVSMRPPSAVGGLRNRRFATTGASSNGNALYSSA